LISTYEKPIADSGLTLTINGNVNYRSERYSSFPYRPEWAMPVLTLVNASIGVGDEDGAWRLSLFSQNLTDQAYATRVFGGFLEANPFTFLTTEGETEASRMGWVPYEAQRIVGITLDIQL
jgi:iron complex outermembrane receptor protein